MAFALPLPFAPLPITLDSVNKHLANFRPLLPPALSLLVLVSNWHCQTGAAEEVRIMATRRVDADGMPLPAPVNLPPGACENESGCMCRGATLAVNVDAAPLAPQLGELLAIPAYTMAAGPALSPQPASDAGLFRSPSISGRMLRAHSVSFLS